MFGLVHHPDDDDLLAALADAVAEVRRGRTGAGTQATYGAVLPDEG